MTRPGVHWQFRLPRRSGRQRPETGRSVTVDPSRLVSRAGTKRVSASAGTRTFNRVERLDVGTKQRPRQRPLDDVSTVHAAEWRGTADRLRRAAPVKLSAATSANRASSRVMASDIVTAQGSCSGSVEFYCFSGRDCEVACDPAHGTPAALRRHRPAFQGESMDVIKLVSQFATPAMLAQVASLLGVSGDTVQKGLGACGPGRARGRLLGAGKRPGGADALGSRWRGSATPARRSESDPAAAASDGSDLLGSLLGGDAVGTLAERARLLRRRAEGRRRLAARAGRHDGAGGAGQGRRGRWRPRARSACSSSNKNEIAAALPADFAEALGDTGLLAGLGAPVRAGAAAPAARLRGPSPRRAAAPRAPPPPLREARLEPLVAVAGDGRRALTLAAQPAGSRRRRSRWSRRPRRSPSAAAPATTPSREPAAPAAEPAAAPADDRGRARRSARRRRRRHRRPGEGRARQLTGAFSGSPTRRRRRRRCPN